MDVVCGVKDMDRKSVEETIHKNTKELFFKNHWNLIFSWNQFHENFIPLVISSRRELSVITWVDPANTEQEGSIYDVIFEYMVI